MERFTNILCVVEAEGGEETVRRAVARAMRNGASLTVATVQPPPLLWSAGVRRADEFRDRAAAENRRLLEALVEPYRAMLPALSISLIHHAFPHVGIIQRVLRENHDLLVYGGRDDRGVAGRLRGTTVRHLLRKSPCPLWIVRSRPNGIYRRILVAVDLAREEDDVGARELNDTLLQLAHSLARTEEAELHVVHAWQFFATGTLNDPRLPLAESTLVEQMKRATVEHQRRLDERLVPYDDESVEVETHLVRGDARTAIPGLAESLRVDLVVMGTVGRSGIQGLLIGNTAESVLPSLQSSVLTVKPPGWESPIRLPEAIPA